MVLLTIVSLSVWYVCGCSSFIYWWTSEFDLTCAELPIILVVGFGGPITYFAGRGIHGKHERRTLVIFKKRK